MSIHDDDRSAGAGRATSPLLSILLTGLAILAVCVLVGIVTAVTP